MVIREKTTLPPDTPFIKVVVDVEQGILAMGGELHIDCVEELEKAGSSFANLWGVNIYPLEKRIDYVSMINIRPQVGNRSMEIQEEKTREKMRQIIERLLF